MFYATAARAVDAEPQEVLKFCLDLESYLEIDQKITKVYECVPSSGGRDFQLSLRASARGVIRPRVELAVRLDPWTSIRFRQTGRRFANGLFRISGEILAEPLDEGTLVTRTYEVETRKPFGFLIRWLTAGWLQRTVELELNHIWSRFNPHVVEIRRRKSH